MSALALAVTCTPLPISPRQTCTIKLTLEDDWVEAALHRFRFHPSIIGKDWDLKKQLQDHWGTSAFWSQSYIHM